jgi:hypothetical protein
MEVKMRRKGDVITMGEFPESSIPDIIRDLVPEGLEGIDLTGYSVISATFGKGGHNKAQELHAKAPGVLVVYKYSWRNGWGEGILLPERFNPSRVKFYKTTAQLVEEEQKTQEAAMVELREQILKQIPKVRVSFGELGNDYLMVRPDQEAFATSWGVKANTLAQAEAGVEEMRPFWSEWNERALEAHRKHKGEGNPGRGNIQIHPNPFNSNKVGMRFGLGGSDQWLLFEKQADGRWVETGFSRSAP